MQVHPHICIPHVCEALDFAHCSIQCIRIHQLWFVDKDAFKLISLQCSVTDNNITKTITRLYYNLKLEVSKIVHSSSIT